MTSMRNNNYTVSNGSSKILPTGKKSREASKKIVTSIGYPKNNSFCVSSNYYANAGLVKYGCIHTTKRYPVVDTIQIKSNDRNIGSFLGIVKSLALLKERRYDNPIYADSFPAVAWVYEISNGTPKIFNVDNSILSELDWATKWLQNNYFVNNVEIWDSKFWGKMPREY